MELLYFVFIWSWREILHRWLMLIIENSVKCLGDGATGGTESLGGGPSKI